MAPRKAFVWHRGRILYYGTEEGFCMAPRKDFCTMALRKAFVWHRGRTLYYGTEEGFCSCGYGIEEGFLYYSTEEGFCMAPRKDFENELFQGQTIQLELWRQQQRQQQQQQQQ